MVAKTVMVYSRQVIMIGHLVLKMQSMLMLTGANGMFTGIICKDISLRMKMESDRKRNEIVGYITIDIPYEPLKVGEIGYIIGEKYQGNKYSYEALKCLLHVYFTDFDLDLIEAKYNSSNKASANILHRLGFKPEALLRDRRMNFLTGEKSDMVICSITKNEFEAQN